MNTENLSAELKAKLVKAQDAMKKLEEQAKAELMKNSETRLAELTKKVADADAAHKVAKAELTALQQACGIEPVKRAASTGAPKSYNFVKASAKTISGHKLALLTAIKDGPNGNLSRESLISFTEKNITSKMKPGSLVSYYTKELIEAGCIIANA